MKAPPKVTYPPVDQCIYCGAGPSAKLTDEHIIPFSLAGHMVLPSASCHECMNITHAFEGKCAGHMFQALRVHQKVPTRRPKKRPKTLMVLDGSTPENPTKLEVAADEAPTVVLFPIFTRPSVMTGAPPHNGTSIVKFVPVATTRDVIERAQRLKDGGFPNALVTGESQPEPLARLLGKIAHAFTIAELGAGAFRPCLAPTILGANGDVGRYIGSPKPGSLPEPAPLEEGVIHRLVLHMIEIDQVRFAAVQMWLFTCLGDVVPSYLAIAGELSDQSFQIHRK